VTREKKLKEILNVRLDEPLAKEIRRLAESQGRSESEVARALLGYGAEVERRLEAQRLMRHYTAHETQQPGRLRIEAEFVPYTREEADEIREGLERGERPLTWDDLVP
jgi:Arc/MetJ-type ribon-helix-helix transcriptional regulator